MATVSYPVFVYRTKQGFTVKSADFPNVGDVHGPDYESALTRAKDALSAEMKRLQAANLAIPPPTPLGNLVSVLGGRVEVVSVEQS